MPHLDHRLRTVATQIRSHAHADIGSDHGHLLKALLKSGRIERAIAIENKLTPWRNSMRTLAGLNADVRYADGFAGLDSGEVDSVSLCGLGGAAIAAILGASPSKVPNVVIAQPNRRPEGVRAWGLQGGFHLVDEQVTSGKRSFLVMRFRKVQVTSGEWLDPVYANLDQRAALLFGPHLIRRWHPSFVARLREEERYLKRLPRRAAPANARLQAIECLFSTQPSATF